MLFLVLYDERKLYGVGGWRLMPGYIQLCFEYTLSLFQKACIVVFHCVGLDLFHLYLYELRSFSSMLSYHMSWLPVLLVVFLKFEITMTSLGHRFAFSTAERVCQSMIHA